LGHSSLRGIVYNGCIATLEAIDEEFYPEPWVESTVISLAAEIDAQRADPDRGVNAALVGRYEGLMKEIMAAQATEDNPLANPDPSVGPEYVEGK
jgi:hypothetical protein